MANTSYNSSITGPNIENAARLFGFASGNVASGVIYSTKDAGFYGFVVNSNKVISFEAKGLYADTPLTDGKLLIGRGYGVTSSNISFDSVTY